MVMVMETTIAVKESTAQILAMLKERMKAKSMDETILRIVHKTENIMKGGFGSNPGLKKFSDKEKARFHEL